MQIMHDRTSPPIKYILPNPILSQFVCATNYDTLSEAGYEYSGSV